MKLIVYSLVQCLLLVGGQVTLKLALRRMTAFEWSRAFFSAQLTNWWFLACGLFFAAAGLLWIYILKHFPLSQAYPLTALSYVLGMVAALFIFHETISPVRWLGAALIVAGCYLIVR